jgi:hypothetical protein
MNPQIQEAFGFLTDRALKDPGAERSIPPLLISSTKSLGDKPQAAFLRQVSGD